ncbi:hypothetical protein [Ammoniphilus sp. 3BR4]|uniref:hypothetical protein n=1 Tax=Ammoniphilus sp. 3BR4 TaxID=3158265 RepID=UPI003467E01E
MKLLSSLIIVISIIFNVSPAIAQIDRAEILYVNTDLTKIGNWWRIPQGVQKMTIFVEAKNTETVLFWLIPTGTAWSQKKLIGYDKDGSDGWSLTWEFGNKRPTHDHIHIQAIGTGTVSDWSINVTTAMP